MHQVNLFSAPGRRLIGQYVDLWRTLLRRDKNTRTGLAEITSQNRLYALGQVASTVAPCTRRN